MKYLDNISEKDILELNIPTGNTVTPNHVMPHDNTSHLTLLSMSHLLTPFYIISHALTMHQVIIVVICPINTPSTPVSAPAQTLALYLRTPY